MSIYKSKNSKFWQYDFQWQGQRFHGSTGESGKRRAEQVEDRVKIEVKTGGGKPQATIDEVALSYWEHRGQFLKDAKGDERRLLRLVLMLGKDRFIRDICESNIVDVIQKRRAEGSQRGKGRAELSNSTINRTVVEMAKRLHRHADLRMKVEVTPIDWAEVRLKEPEPRVRELSATEEEAVFDHLRSDMRPIARTSLLTGLRKENLVSLKKSNVDLAGRRIVLKIKSDKPGRVTHVIPLTDELVTILDAEMALHEHACVFTYQPHDTHRRPNFEKPRRPMTVSVLRCQWDKALAASGVQDFRWHDIRHTTGSRTTRVAGLNTTRALLGHKSISTTARYAHATENDVRAAMEKMDDASVRESRNSPEAGESK